MTLLIDRGRVGRVEVNGRGFHTPGGVEVGDTEALLRAAYGGRLRRKPNEYEPGGSYYVLDRGRGRRIVFETDGRRVDYIRAGRRPDVDLVEGCA